MQSPDVQNATELLSDTHRRCENALSRISPVRDEFEDEIDADRECPVFNSFYDVDGNEGIKKMINFTAPEFRVLYSKLHEDIVTKWNVGRGRKSPHKSMDVFFMCLTVLKHVGSWYMLAHIFVMKAPSFERLVVGYMKVASRALCDIFVHNVSQAYTMACLEENSKRFKNFPSAIEAVDVTFQQSNRPSENMQEGKKYFSGKHKLYGYKLEVAVRPNGMASAFSKHYPGSVSDIGIMTKRIQTHLFRMEKCDEDKEVEDNNTDTLTHWAVIAYKGYQGADEMLHCITPIKKPPQGRLTQVQERFNVKLSSDRIIVENYFGRMQSLWNILSIEYKWSEAFYDTIFAMGVAVTNFHVDNMPLRVADGEWFNRYLNKLNLIGNEKNRKRVEQQSTYGARRNDSLRIGFREVARDNDETQPTD